MSQSQKAALDIVAYPNGRPASTSHLARAKDRRRQIAVSEGKVVAELTLYFWKRLYGPEYDQSLWRTTLKRTFPQKKLKRAEIAVHLEQIYQSRNRLAHHEPVLHRRFDDTMSAIEFIILNLEDFSGSGGTPLARLLEGDLAETRVRAAELHRLLNAYRSR